METVTSTKPVLKNEFTLNKESLLKLFSTGQRVFVMGYGSLLFTHGWLGRGMHRPPKKLIACFCNGFERGPWGIYGYTNFYGIIRSAKDRLNAVLGEVRTPIDYASLMNTEKVVGLHYFANYRIVDVTKNISHANELPSNAVVHAVVNRPSNRKKLQESLPTPDYYEYVWRGVRLEHTKEFQEDFLENGGFKSWDDVQEFIKNGGKRN